MVAVATHIQQEELNQTSNPARRAALARVFSQVIDETEPTDSFAALSQCDEFRGKVIDTAKVVRSALQHAASVAGLLVTTEAMVAERPKKEPAAAGAPGGNWRHGRRHG